MRELLIVVALAGAAQAALTAVRAPAWLPARERMLRPRMLAGAATIVVVALFAGALLGGGAVTESARDARSWVDRQWQEFLDPAAAPGPGTQRLLTARGARSDPYRVALEGFKDHPIIGGGAGSFEVRYMRDRHIDLKLRDAHSLPLETLSELGAVGLLALLVFFGAVAAAAWRGIRGTSVGRPQEAAAVTAAFVVWLVDVCVDWDWEMPALTGTAVVLSATLFQRRRRRRSSRHGDTAIA
jgi:O-antigen ligase